jgi:outer membrane murein-binding lipoprotein Lpp
MHKPNEFVTKEDIELLTTKITAGAGFKTLKLLFSLIAGISGLVITLLLYIFSNTIVSIDNLSAAVNTLTTKVVALERDRESDRRDIDKIEDRVYKSREVNR